MVIKFSQNVQYGWQNCEKMIKKSFFNICWTINLDIPWFKIFTNFTLCSRISNINQIWSWSGSLIIWRVIQPDKHVLATMAMNMTKYAMIIPAQWEVELRMKPTSKSVVDVVLHLTLSCLFLRRGKATWVCIYPSSSIWHLFLASKALPNQVDSCHYYFALSQL